jgi:transcription elongation factor GreA
MNNNQQIQVTKAALDALKLEHDQLVNSKRPKLVDRLAFATSQGDLTENDDYQRAREELEFLDGRISELAEVIKNASVVASNGHANKVGIGTKVTVKNGKSKQIFNIVGEWEANPMEQKISHISPLGQVLVGKKVGDKVAVEAPAGTLNYEILAIN